MTFTLTVLMIGACSSPRSISTMTAGELLKTGMDLYNRHKYLRAIEHFQACVYNYPGDMAVDTAQYYLALSYFGNEEYEVAQVEFNRLVLNYPASPFFEHAIFMRAVCYYESTPKDPGMDQTELNTAIRQFEDFIIDFPDSEVLPDVQKYLHAALDRLARKDYTAGLVYSRMGAFESAKIYFQKVIDDYTESEYAVQALYDIARMEYKQKNYSEARVQFQNFVAVYPENKFVPKALKMIEKSAFEDAKKAFKEAQPEAREKLDAFLKDFPESNHVDAIRKYLGELADSQPAPVEAEETVGT